MPEPDWQPRVTRERASTVAILLGSLAIIVWPTDWWVFAGEREMIPLIASWRIVSVSIAAAMVLVGRTQLPALPAIGGLALLWTAFTAACVGLAPAPNPVFLLAISGLQFLWVAVPAPPRTRAWLQVASVIAVFVCYIGANPAHLRDPLLAFASVITLSCAACAWALGQAIHRLAVQNHEQRLALEEANARAQRLLHNVLPARVASRLERDPGAIAESCEEVVVLFADVVGFTPRAAEMTPAEVVALLNDVFSTFDGLTERFGLEKIKTIGDAYMAAAGLPGSASDPVARTLNLAIAMLEASRRLGLPVRIGVHVGPAVAGVIGTRKLSYDLWGDTVNTASRMESHGEPGRIHVTAAVRDRLAGRYRFDARGTIAIKGKGPMETYFLGQGV